MHTSMTALRRATVQPLGPIARLRHAVPTLGLAATRQAWRHSDSAGTTNFLASSAPAHAALWYSSHSPASSTTAPVFSLITEGQEALSFQVTNIAGAGHYLEIRNPGDEIVAKLGPLQRVDEPEAAILFDGSLFQAVAADATGYPEMTQASPPIPCFRTLGDTEAWPFIGGFREPFALPPIAQLDDGSHLGVHFSSGPESPSPHVTTTHVECRYHIRGEGDTLQDILAANPSLAQELPALRLSVKAEPTYLTTNPLDDGSTEFQFVGGETYRVRLPKDADTLPSIENIVTRESILAALSEYEVPQNPDEKKAIMIHIEGGEHNNTSWPFLTNEAIELLVDTLGFDVIVLNIPSMDREVDGGVTPNHEIVFSNPNNLIIETAKLEDVPEGWNRVVLNINPHAKYKDCGPSELTVTAVPS
mgnify:CR=1 FL=1